MQEVTPQDIEFMRQACLLCDNSTLEVRTGCVIVFDRGVVSAEGWNVSEKHAEVMALEKAYLASSSLINATVYVTRFPCEDCAKKLTKNGISKLFYMSDHFSSGNSALPLLKASNIPVIQILENQVWDTISI